MSLPGRTFLHAASVFCILGLTSSLVHLQLFGSEPEMDSSGFRSRSLLSAAAAGSIKVRPVRSMGVWLAASCLAVSKVTSTPFVTSGFYKERDHWFYHWVFFISPLPLLQTSTDVHQCEYDKVMNVRSIFETYVFVQVDLGGHTGIEKSYSSPSLIVGVTFQTPPREVQIHKVGTLYCI